MENEISSEMARIHAHLCGDGSVYSYKTSEKGRSFIYVVGYYNKNQILLDKFRQDFSKIFGVKMKMRNNRDVSVRSKRIFQYLLDNFGRFHSKEWRVSKLIKNGSNKIKLEWLKSFFEDEAYHEKRYNRLKIKSVNLFGLKDVGDLLDSLKIKYTLTGPNCDESYYLTLPNFNTISEFNDFIKQPIRK